MGSISHIMASEDTKNLTTALSARAYGYGYPGVAGAPFAGPMGAMSPHRTAYYGMQEHIKAEERMLEQRRTLYTDLRSAESKEASCVEKRLSDEQRLLRLVRPRPTWHLPWPPRARVCKIVHARREHLHILQDTAMDTLVHTLVHTVVLLDTVVLLLDTDTVLALAATIKLCNAVLAVRLSSLVA